MKTACYYHAITDIFLFPFHASLSLFKKSAIGKKYSEVLNLDFAFLSLKNSWKRSMQSKVEIYLPGLSIFGRPRPTLHSVHPSVFQAKPRKRKVLRKISHPQIRDTHAPPSCFHAVTTTLRALIQTATLPSAGSAGQWLRHAGWSHQTLETPSVRRPEERMRPSDAE